MTSPTTCSVVIPNVPADVPFVERLFEILGVTFAAAGEGRWCADAYGGWHYELTSSATVTGHTFRLIVSTDPTDRLHLNSVRVLGSANAGEHCDFVVAVLRKWDGLQAIREDVNAKHSAG